MKGWVWLALAVFVLGAPATARAQDADAIQTAKNALTAGKRAYKAQRYDVAVEFFAKAYQSYPDPIALYYEGLALQKLGACRPAEERLQRAKQDPRLPPEAVQGATRALSATDDCVQRRLQALLPKGDEALAAGDATAAAGVFRGAFQDTGARSAAIRLASAQLALDDCAGAEASIAAAAAATPDPSQDASFDTLEAEYQRICRADSDQDGIVDRSDGCPKEAEDLDSFEDQDGCPDPDNDQDGLADASDKCPNEAEDADGFLDDDGCLDRDNDEDWIADAADRCPNEAEDADGHEDDDGCPDPDNDGDSVADAADLCPTELEDIDDYRDGDGCPELNYVPALMAGAASAVALGGAALFDVSAGKQASELRTFTLVTQEERTPICIGDCDVWVVDDGWEERREYERRRTRLVRTVWAARLLYGAGILGAATTAGLFLFDDGSDQPRVAVGLGPTGVTLTFQGTSAP